MFFRELMVGENQQAEVPFHFLSIDESQRLVSFNVPMSGCYGFICLYILIYLDYDVFWYDLICVRYI
ncbi:hypothetical protein [Anaerobutyricum hallii]|uniref:hypothetical protein n=1 Tax=Anaerobutyricum hallii TaxID=39488 RepID=UPI0011C23225|nr:hypothetical protein [Anaerobutyricum hallii]